jgi:hypothetical protein
MTSYNTAVMTVIHRDERRIGVIEGWYTGINNTKHLAMNNSRLLALNSDAIK